jgi:integrase
MSSIKRRADGAWRARYRDDTGREHARHFDRKVDAQRWIDEVTASVVTGNYVDPKAGKITFRAYFDEWAARQMWVRSTAQGMEIATRSTPFGDLPIKAIRRSHIETWVKAMSAAGLAPGTVSKRYKNVRAIFRAALRDKVIATDPTDGVMLPRKRRSEIAMTVPTPEQVGKIIRAAQPWFRPFIGLCAFAGLRLGEAAAVKLEDIDFLRRTLTVSRQVQRAEGRELDVRAPKYGSERVIFIPDELITMLAAHVETVGVRPAGWIFAGAGEGPMGDNRVAHWWRSAREAAGLSGIRLHDLRHFYASGLIAQGCDVVTVQRALGHANAATTLGTYSHLWPTAEDRTRKAAGAMMASALGGPADSVRTETV